jgi:AcrR family transcriptional regulator
MERLLASFKISVPEGVYIKDPETSDLGKKIIERGINLIHELGFDAFTFKKLGAIIESNESSIYRYFENKHKFLLYLTSWYWGWIEYQLVMETHAVSDPMEKLLKAVNVITREVKNDTSYTSFSLVALQQIMIEESSKAFLNRAIDQENELGLFLSYKRVHERVQELIEAVNPSYAYPASLASALLTGFLKQFYFNSHLPSLTSCSENICPADFYVDLINKTLV